MDVRTIHRQRYLSPLRWDYVTGAAAGRGPVKEVGALRGSRTKVPKGAFHRQGRVYGRYTTFHPSISITSQKDVYNHCC